MATATAADIAPTITNNRSSLKTDPLRNFRFLVEFLPHSGLTNSGALTALSKATFGFTSVSGMSVTTDSIAYREGGYNTTVHQIPGQTTFTPITLQRGVILGSRQSWDWMRNLFATVEGGASTRGVGENFRCDLVITVLSHPIPSARADVQAGATTSDHAAMKFKVYNAWVTSLAYSDLNAGDNSLFVEQMTLVHEGFDVNWADNLSVSASDTFPYTKPATA